MNYHVILCKRGRLRNIFLGVNYPAFVFGKTRLKIRSRNESAIRNKKIGSSMRRWYLQKSLLSGNLLFVVTLRLLPSFAGDDSLNALQSVSLQNVLIVNGGSYLENTVSSLVRDSLTQKGFTIKIIPLASLKSEQPSNYRATIIMNAVHTSKVAGIVRSYARSKGGERSNILICTVYGEEWKSGMTRIDAVTAATKTLNPAGVAVKIISAVLAVMQPDKPPLQ